MADEEAAARNPHDPAPAGLRGVERHEGIEGRQNSPDKQPVNEPQNEELVNMAHDGLGEAGDPGPEEGQGQSFVPDLIAFSAQRGAARRLATPVMAKTPPATVDKFSSSFPQIFHEKRQNRLILPAAPPGDYPGHEDRYKGRRGEDERKIEKKPRGFGFLRRNPILLDPKDDHRIARPGNDGCDEKYIAVAYLVPLSRRSTARERRQW